eukprot:scpid41157/ scgid33802/ 
MRMYMYGSTLYFQGSQHKTMHYVVLTDTCTCTCTCSTMPSSVHVHYSDNINHCEQFPVTTKHYLNVLCFHTRVCRMVRTNSLPAQEALLLNHHFEVLLAVFGECLLTDIQLERQRTPVCILLLNQHHDLVLIQPAAHWQWEPLCILCSLACTVIADKGYSAPHCALPSETTRQVRERAAGAHCSAKVAVTVTAHTPSHLHRHLSKRVNMGKETVTGIGRAGVEINMLCQAQTGYGTSMGVWLWMARHWTAGNAIQLSATVAYSTREKYLIETVRRCYSCQLCMFSVCRHQPHQLSRLGSIARRKMSAWGLKQRITAAE